VCRICQQCNDAFMALLRFGLSQARACHRQCEALWFFSDDTLDLFYRLGCGHYCERHTAEHLCCRCR